MHENHGICVEDVFNKCPRLQIMFGKCLSVQEVSMLHMSVSGTSAALV